MIRPESIGYVRHAALMLAKASEEIRQEWDDGEIILTPQQTEEMQRLLRDVRKQTAGVTAYASRFNRVADARRVQ